MFFSTVDPETPFLPERDELLLRSDAELADICRIDVFCGTGPGGQHRNRNYTAVRLVTKVPAGFTAEESSFRSQKQNLEAALQKLRLLLAFAWRKTPPERFNYTHYNENNPNYPLELAKLLDVVCDCKFDHKNAALRANITPTRLLKELAREYIVWQEFQKCRLESGLSELKKPRIN
jgi:hypothetical protein